MKKIALVFALVLVGACRHDPTPATNQPPTTLRVENRAFLDMTVYIVRGSASHRLGNAGGNSTTILKIPDRFLFGPTSLRFQVRPIAARREPVSEEILVTPGDEVSIVIPPA
ncbi:MAG: hypothetical protein H0U64_09105 [Gemmatimonadaceae bacterium]|nr:hypothetical protein [Gemmatimonadaceae bacterium]